MYIIAGSMGAGALFSWVLWLLYTAIRVRQESRGLFVGIFEEANGLIVNEAMRVDPKRPLLVTDRYGGSYRIPSQVSSYVPWPPTAPEFLRVPVAAAMYRRATPEPMNEIISAEANNAIDWFEANIPLRAKTLTALAVTACTNENIPRQAAEAAEASTREKRAAMPSMVIVGAALTIIMVVGGVFFYQNQQKLESRLAEMQRVTASQVVGK